jgi:hypothetical protein
MKRLVVQFSPPFLYFPLSFKYSPQHPVLKHPQSLIFLWGEKRKKLVLYILISRLLDITGVDKRL